MSRVEVLATGIKIEIQAIKGPFGGQSRNQELLKNQSIRNTRLQFNL